MRGKKMTLHSAKQFHGFTMAALDGKAGTVKETLFDEDAWVIRYLVVDSGDWLGNSEILIAPMSVVRLDWKKSVAYIELTIAQIKEGPGIGVTRPILRTDEAEFLDHYGYTHYWSGLQPAMPTASSDAPQASATRHDNAEQELARVASHLHSSLEAIGCAVRTSDQTDGQIEDLQFDDQSWDIAFLVIDPHDWSAESSVLVSPSRVERVDWEEGQGALSMTRVELERCPKY
jgi:hypothetical protein